MSSDSVLGIIVVAAFVVLAAAGIIPRRFPRFPITRGAALWLWGALSFLWCAMWVYLGIGLVSDRIAAASSHIWDFDNAPLTAPAMAAVPPSPAPLTLADMFSAGASVGSKVMLVALAPPALLLFLGWGIGWVARPRTEGASPHPEPRK